MIVAELQSGAVFTGAPAGASSSMRGASAPSSTIESRGVILHIEDECGVRQALATFLLNEGYIVSSAACGPEAMELVARGLRPDLLIVDFKLDDEMNGAEAAEQLRRAMGYALPVIMLTGDPTNAGFPWITEMPVWLARKPMRPEVLLAAVTNLVQLSRSIRPLLQGHHRDR